MQENSGQALSERNLQNTRNKNGYCTSCMVDSRSSCWQERADCSRQVLFSSLQQSMDDGGAPAAASPLQQQPQLNKCQRLETRAYLQRHDRVVMPPIRHLARPRLAVHDLRRIYDGNSQPRHDRLCSPVYFDLLRWREMGGCPTVEAMCVVQSQSSRNSRGGLRDPFFAGITAKRTTP